MHGVMQNCLHIVVGGGGRGGTIGGISIVGFGTTTR